ncbi:MAG: peptide-methionine (S)-S-oxide reductase MsrA [Pseudomonadota bacterium]
MLGIKATGVGAFIAVLTALSACAQETSEEKETLAPAEDTTIQTAVFAGGCFWCIESDLEKLDGVGDVVSGYAGGASDNPTYRNHGQHLEVVRAPFDPSVISYRELTDYFLRHIDPLDDGGQFCDRGNSYRTAIFYADEAQKEAAEAAIKAAEDELGQTIVTPARMLDKFWIAEDYHQDYYKKNPVRYKFYRTGCGRDRRVNEVWGK